MSNMIGNISTEMEWIPLKSIYSGVSVDDAIEI